MEIIGNKPGGHRYLPSISYLYYWGAKLAIPSLNRLEVTLYNITRPYRNIRVTGDTRERIPYKKTPIDRYSKLKIRTIKNQT